MRPSDRTIRSTGKCRLLGSFLLHYRTIILLDGDCTQVTRSQDHSQCSPHVVQGDVLLNIDDNIDTVLGLAAFYK